jgi:hypothetical protein
MAEEYSKEEIAEAITAANGLISVAAQSLGCSRTTIYSAIKRWKYVQEALEDSRERTLDFAEGKLFQQIKKNNMTAIIFFLKTQGKSRGYVERQEITGADGKPVPIAIINADPDEV